jgi:hypothetical protein
MPRLGSTRQSPSHAARVSSALEVGSDSPLYDDDWTFGGGAWEGGPLSSSAVGPAAAARDPTAAERRRRAIVAADRVATLQRGQLEWGRPSKELELGVRTVLTHFFAEDGRWRRQQQQQQQQQQQHGRTQSAGGMLACCAGRATSDRTRRLPHHVQVVLASDTGSYGLRLDKHLVLTGWQPVTGDASRAVCSASGVPTVCVCVRACVCWGSPPPSLLELSVRG